MILNIDGATTEALEEMLTRATEELETLRGKLDAIESERSYFTAHIEPQMVVNQFGRFEADAILEDIATRFEAALFGFKHQARRVHLYRFQLYLRAQS